MRKNARVGGLYVLSLGVSLAIARVQAGELYVSTTGSDSNPGSSAQPFRTITYAYSQASAGTTILVAPGLYTDYTSGWGLHLGNSGTAASPIVLKSLVQGGAIIDGQDASDRNQAVYIDGSYNVVEGFEIRNGPNGGITIWSDGNQILYNEIHNNGNPATTNPNGLDGIYDDQTTSGNVYAGNYIHDNGRAGGSNLDHGLYLCGDNDLVINNVVIRNDSRGLQIAGYSTINKMQVYNNVFAWNGVDGVTLWQAFSGVTIQNNIMYQNGRYGLQFSAATGGGIVIDQNLVYGNIGGSFSFTDSGSTASYTLGTVISSDPQFVNETSSGFDAHLGSGSPAIGAGYNLSSSFSADLAGSTRPASGPWDLGAYVYASSDTTPPTVAISSPANGATVSGTVTNSASASDNVGVASVQFQWDGANLGNPLTVAPYKLMLDTTTVSNGLHSLTAIAWDAAGNQATATPITVTVTNAVAVLGLPTVTVAATSANASRVGLSSGVFTILRTGNTASALTANYSLGGTASNGVDCISLGASLTIPVGASSSEINVIPLPSATCVGPRKLTLALSPSSGYLVGSSAAATITIAGNTIPSTLAKTSGNGFKITWSSTLGKIYRVAYKNNLKDPTWTNLSGLITALGATTSYTDATASGKTHRFYVVYVTD
jgi:hypothetical protein